MTDSQEAPKTRVAGYLGCLGAVVVFMAALVALHFALLDGLDGALKAVLLRADTEYSPGYSDHGFRAVKEGMEAAEVERLLGKPLKQSLHAQGGTDWFFSQSPRGSPPGSRYLTRRIHFCTNGRVCWKMSRCCG